MAWNKTNKRIPLLATTLGTVLAFTAAPAHAQPEPPVPPPIDVSQPEAPASPPEAAPQEAPPTEAAPQEASPVEPEPTPEPAPVEEDLAPVAVVPVAAVVVQPRPAPVQPVEVPAPAQSTSSQEQKTEDASDQEKGEDASSDEAADSEPADEEKEDEGSGGGLYFDLGGGPMFGLNSSHEWNNTCPEVAFPGGVLPTWTPSCSTKAPIGVVAEARIGVRIGVLGIEGFGLGAGDWSSAKLGEPEPPVDLPGFATDMNIGRVGGGFGGGLRLITPPKWIRISAAGGGGIMFRHVYTNVSSLDGSSTGYTAPIVRADISLTFFKTFTLGVMGWMEFSKTVSITPDLSSAGDLAGVPLPPELVAAFEDALGDVTVFEGDQYFIGPYFGMHFGN